MSNMFKYDQNQNRVILCCDLCGQPVDIRTASFAGPLSGDRTTQPVDSIIVLVHNECETLASKSLKTALGPAFGTISAAGPLQKAIAIE